MNPDPSVLAGQIQTLWLLTSAALVLFMQAGFTVLEAGTVRHKNSINVAIKNVVTLCVSFPMFYLIGYSIMFGPDHHGLYGTPVPFMADRPVSEFAAFVFQAGFCATATTIVSGGVAERCRFLPYTLVVFAMSVAIYPVFGHSVWGGGLLAKAGYHDFAGSSVVHMCGAGVTLAGIQVLGPRRGRFGTDGKPRPVPASSMPLVALGVVILAFGWIGFNGGSAPLSERTGLIVANTLLAGCLGGLGALLVTWAYRGLAGVDMILNGMLGGLVAVTASADVVDAKGALIIGILGGLAVVVVSALLERAKLDDAVGAVPVHGGAGIVGILCVGLFANQAYLDSVGLGRLELIGVQATGAAACALFAYAFQPLQMNIGTFNGVIGANTFTLQASGGTAPYHYSITPGFTPPPGFRVQDGPPLPTGFTVSPNGTGGFLGVATTSGTFTTSIRVTDAAATVVDRSITLNITPLQISALPPKATMGVPYSFTLTGYGGSGGAGYSWSATGLPAGWNMSAGGVLSGTPTTGNFSVVITLTDSTLLPPLNSLTRSLPITVNPFEITTPGLLPNATAGVFYSQTITAPGCPAPCAFTPTFFAGLNLNSAGVLSGTPFLQTGSFQVTATGAGPVSVSKQFTLFVTSPTTPLSSGFGTFGDQTVGNFLTNSILPFGGTPPYSASVVSGTLPPGLSLVGPSDTLCTNCNPGLPYLVGRAMQVGTFTFTLKFMDSVGGSFTPAPYTWNISPITNSYFNLPLAGTTLVAGTPYTQPLLVFGGSNSYTFQAFNALPAGLSIDTNTGVISGTPTTGGNLTTQIRISEGGIVKFTAFIGFNVTGPPTVVTLPATNVTNTSVRLNGTVNPSGLATTGNFEWGTTTAYGNTTSTVNFGSSFFNQTAGTNITCVAGSVYHYRLIATNSQGARQGADQTFTCGAPPVFTFNPFDVTAFSATLNGGVNPNGLATTANYQWGLTNAYGNSTPVQSVGSGTQQVFIDGGEITGLSCGTVYHFRATATNANGTSFGNDITFSTGTCSPAAFTGVATVVGMTTANLVGAANPNGTATTARVQWGTTTAYGNETPEQSMGSGFDTVPLTSVPIAGLTCNTTYHMRTVATNSFGTSNGFDRAFMTAPCVAGSFKGIVYALNKYPFTNLIYAYGVSSAGTLTQLPGFPMPTGGAGDADNEGSEQLTYDSAKGRLYAINILTNTLSAFSVNPRTGALTPMPYSPIPLPPGGWTTVHVHPSGSPVVVGDFLGSVASFAVTATTATQASGSPYSSGVPLVYSSAFSRDGNYLYIGAGDGVSGNPSTAGFSVAPGTGVLTPLPGSPFALGGLYPIGYATDASGRLFSVNNEGNSVRAFTTADGVPAPVAGNPFPAPGSNNALAGVLHPAGFYMAADSDAKVGVFQIAGSGGSTTLTNVAGSPFTTGGSELSALALSKEGNLLFAANSETRNLSVFGVNSGTGALTTLTLQPAETLSNFGPITGVAFVPSGSPVVDDVDGDGKTDLAIFRPSTGTWWVKESSANYTTYRTQTWGISTDIPVDGDFDGDGKTDLAVYRPDTGTWWIVYSSTNYTTFHAQAWGTSTDIPVAGDFDGDGKTDIAVYRPDTGTWWIVYSSTNYTTFHAQAWGTSTDIPVAGDFDGDGKTDIAVYRPATGTWWILYSSTNYTTFHAQAWGTSTDIPVAGDFDGDGKTDIAVYRPATGTWWILYSSTNYTTFHAQWWGTSTDIPVAGDFDGDGKTDIAAYRPGTGTWWILNSSTNYTTFDAQWWGISTDVPLPIRP